MDLTQNEIEQLFILKKYEVSKLSVDFPMHGEKIDIELQNETGRIKFIADINRNNKIVNKVTYQLRHNKIYIIRRLDLAGNHTNPTPPAPAPLFEPFANYIFNREDHVHFYFEGYGERWALPLTEMTNIGIENSDDLYDKMKKFFKYCNVELSSVKKVLPF